MAARGKHYLGRFQNPVEKVHAPKQSFITWQAHIVEKRPTRRNLAQVQGDYVI